MDHTPDPELTPDAAANSETKLEKSAKNLVKKFVKLTGHNSAYNDLTSFEYEGNERTGNGSYWNLLKSHVVNLFWADLSHSKPLCIRSWG